MFCVLGGDVLGELGVGWNCCGSSNRGLFGTWGAMTFGFSGGGKMGDMDQ